MSGGTGSIMDIFLKLKNRHILLVDDDEWIRDSLSIYFQSEDCRISVYETAEKALEEIDRRKFDVIITDYKLPGMDGIAFLDKIKQSLPKAVKIMITAYASEVDARQAKQAGAHDLIPKPYTWEDIEVCLDRLIDNDVLDAVKSNKIDIRQRC